MVTESTHIISPNMPDLHSFTLIQNQCCHGYLDHLTHTGLDSVKGDLRVCVVGLHCCGDLASSTLTLFTHHSLPSLTTLVLVPCCYHKMASPQWQPSSATLRRILGERQDVAINTFALRLAAQETKHRWVVGGCGMCVSYLWR